MAITIRLTYMTGLLMAAAITTGCASSSGTQGNTSSQPQDIYAALNDGDIQYRDDSGPQTSNRELVQQQVSEIRSLYFRRDFTTAAEKAERLLRVNGDTAEAYYWLARIHMDQADYAQAYNMASKGVAVTDDPNMKRELERVQSQAQMGNY